MVKFKDTNICRDNSGSTPNNRRPRILVLSHPPLMAQGMRLILEKAGEFEIVGGTESYQFPINLINQLKPDIVLLDTQLNDIDSMEVSHLITSQFPQVKLILLGSSDSDEQVLQAIKAGATAFVPKELSADKLLDIVTQVAKGTFVLTNTLMNKPRIISQMVEQFRAFANANPLTLNSTLTEREMEVLHHLACGASNKEIAYSLNISDQTVKNHVSNIFKKLNVDRRTRAVLVAIENGWIKEYGNNNFTSETLYQ